MFDVVNKNVQLLISVTGHTDRPSTNWRGRDDNTTRDLVGLRFIERGRRSFPHALNSQACRRGPHSSGRLARPLVRLLPSILSC